MLFLRSLVALSFLSIVPSALPNPVLPLPLYEREINTSSTPLPPSQDPFYTAPYKYELAEPGTILRIRSAPGNLTEVISNCSAAYNILFRTTDTRYRPSWAVTTLFVPYPSSSENISGSALLSYQIPYNTVDVDASPSYALYVQGPDFPDISAALGLGWFVNVPDFEGPTASMIAGVQEGHATLDSVRAVLESGLGLSSQTQYALWGYSGGSVASEWAAELQAQYAPELKFAGMAIGGLPNNVTSALYAVSGTYFAGLIPSGLLGITNQFPEAYELLISRLKTTGPYNRTTFLSVKEMDYNQEQAAFAYQDVFDYFVDGEAIIQSPIIKEVIETNGIMGEHGVPQMPTFIYKAIADEIAAIAETDAMVNKYCAAGVNILYQRNTVGGHFAEYTNGDARAFEWLVSVLDGTYSEDYNTTGCTIQNVTVGDDTSPL